MSHIHATVAANLCTSKAGMVVNEYLEGGGLGAWAEDAGGIADAEYAEILDPGHVGGTVATEPFHLGVIFRDATTRRASTNWQSIGKRLSLERSSFRILFSTFYPDFHPFPLASISLAPSFLLPTLPGNTRLHAGHYTTRWTLRNTLDTMQHAGHYATRWTLCNVLNIMQCTWHYTTHLTLRCDYTMHLTLQHMELHSHHVLAFKRPLCLFSARTTVLYHHQGYPHPRSLSTPIVSLMLSHVPFINSHQQHLKLPHHPSTHHPRLVLKPLHVVHTTHALCSSLSMQSSSSCLTPACSHICCERFNFMSQCDIPEGHVPELKNP
ncbi:uncharacterized protein LACBIDRAFT_334656 [Laccaria bicolor S238N-H82]|uniref:Predicted protein n=1 Tax=Laccaria bicolor (strain S238N-H82 / ATCC MYA-4686) TaxID=486041 RepID=B0DZV2_LACBS|nr:uncharacterized protein LACBIDRAFT_334656 [Laccaria bicolor S238N-H82]EDQ99901.1 predicted protein [Laccaria bicolor S238N-H82]|eukprot:XP_001889444.1 predicted protein [Laccaria bicolor S238N-H82]